MGCHTPAPFPASSNRAVFWKRVRQLHNKLQNAPLDRFTAQDLPALIRIMSMPMGELTIAEVERLEKIARNLK